MEEGKEETPDQCRQAQKTQTSSDEMQIGRRGRAEGDGEGYRPRILRVRTKYAVIHHIPYSVQSGSEGGEGEAGLSIRM